jgi:hypothetical protein
MEKIRGSIREPILQVGAATNYCFAPGGQTQALILAQA